MFSGPDRFVWTSLFFLNLQRIAAIPAALLPAALPLSSGRCLALALGQVHPHAVSTPRAHPKACPRLLSLPRERGLGTLSFALPFRPPHPSQDRCPRMPGNPRNSHGLLRAYRSSACTLSAPRLSALRKCRFAARSVFQERKLRPSALARPAAESRQDTHPTLVRFRSQAANWPRRRSAWSHSAPACRTMRC